MADLIPFAYHNYSIRTLQHDDGATWFIATDVCAVLGQPNVSQVCARLDEDEKGIHTLDTPGGQQEILIVNEPGLYKLIMRSRKQEAKTFQRWVTHDVLPQIRKTGAYGQPVPKASEQFPELRAIAQLIESTAEARLLAEAAQTRAHAAELTAARAEGKAERAQDTADLALADARTMTLEEFVLSNGLLRQMPEAQWPAYARWLTAFCLARGHDVTKGQVLGKRWQLENVYPVQALCALKYHEQTKPSQVTLIRPIETPTPGGA